MLLQVLKYDILCDGPIGRRKVPSAPKAASPIAFPDRREFTLDLVGRSSLHLAHEIADCELWRHRYEHVDVIARQNTANDINAIFSAHLADDIANALTQITLENLVAIFRRPHDVIAVIKNAVFSSVVLHDRILRKMSLEPLRAAHFPEDTIINDSSR